MEAHRATVEKALMLRSVGCNVENASYGECGDPFFYLRAGRIIYIYIAPGGAICAERTAYVKAVVGLLNYVLSSIVV